MKVNRWPPLQRLWEQVLASRIATGTAWSLLGTGVTTVSQMVQTILLARFLGVEVFGMLGLWSTTVSMVGSLAGMGLSATATKYIASARGKHSEDVYPLMLVCTGASVGSSLLVGALMAALAPFLAGVVLKVPALEGEVYWAIPLLLTTSLGGTLTGVLAGFERFREIAFVTVLRACVAVLLVPVAAYWGGLRAVVVSRSVVSIIGLLYMLYWVRRIAGRTFRRPRWSEIRPHLGILHRFALPAMLGSLSVTPVYWVINAILMRSPDGLTAVAVTSAVNKWRQVLRILPGLLGSVMLPVLSSTHAACEEQEDSEAIGLLSQLQSLVGAITVPLAVLMIGLARQLMMLYGGDFGGSAEVLVLVVLAVAIYAIGMPVGTALPAFGRMWQGTTINLLWGLVLIGVTYTLIDHGALAYGIGMAAAHVLSTLLPFVALPAAVHRKALPYQLGTTVALFGLAAMRLWIDRVSWPLFWGVGLAIIAINCLLVFKRLDLGLGRAAPEAAET